MRRVLKSTLTLFICLCLCLGMCALSPMKAAADNEIPKLLTTAVPTPVALMDVNTIPAATSTPGCYISGYNWYDSSGNVITGQFGTGNVKVVIQVSTMDGFCFAPDVAVYLNNGRADYSLSADLKTVTLTRVYTPDIWAPTVNKHPGNETVDEGGMATFVVTADYTTGYEWYISSPDGSRSMKCSELQSAFPGVTVNESYDGKVIIHNTPADLDGWQVRCAFKYPGGETYSHYAKLTVRHEERETAPEVEDIETAAMTPAEPAEDITEAPAEEPAATPEPEAEREKDDHVHDFSGAWQKSDSEHWKQCVCGEKDQLSAHDMVWTTFSAATRRAPGVERGVCRVCSHTATREIEYEGSDFDTFKLMGYALIGIGVLIVLIILLMIITAIRDSVRRSRRRRRRRRKY